MNERLLQARKWFTRQALLWLARLVELFSLIVPYHLGVRVGGALGCMAFYVLRRERNRAIEHLNMVFGDKGPQWVRRTARQSFMHLGKSLLEVMLINPERIKRVVELHGEDNLREAMQQGKGAVYVTGHIGNWEMMAHYVSATYPVSVVAAPLEPEQVNDMIVRLRSRMGVRTILRGRPGASKELIRIFKENRILGILIDQDTDVESVFVDFMGRPAWTPTAAAAMAIKFGAPVLFGYIQRGADDRHTIIIEGPLAVTVTGNLQDDIRNTTAMLTSKIEAVIRNNPEQWVWMHRRWRRQP